MLIIHDYINIDYLIYYADRYLYMGVPAFFTMLNHRALCYRYLDDNALIDLNKAVALDPSQAVFFQNRSYLFTSESKYQDAMKDILHAEKLGLVVDKSYVEMLKAMIEQEK